MLPERLHARTIISRFPNKKRTKKRKQFYSQNMNFKRSASRTGISQKKERSNPRN